MFNLVGGFIALALGILLLVNWPWRVLEVFQGLLPIALIVGGIIAAIAGWELIKHKVAASTGDDDDDEKPRKK
jgi:MFS family permease